MAQKLRFYLFGDQTYDYDEQLRALLTSHDPVVRSFLERAYYTLRAEVARLPNGYQARISRFSSIAELLSQRREHGVDASLEQALTVVYQLASFMRLHSERSLSYPSADNAHCLGLCTGALSAAAVSSSRSLSELLPAAIETVILAFRTGLHASDSGRRIEESSAAAKCWSISLQGLEGHVARKLLEEWSNKKRLPPMSRPYISAYASGGVTISGPPSVLAELRNTPGLSKLRAKDIPIHAPYHSSAIFNQCDVETILSSALIDLTSRATHVPILSTGTGRLVWAGTLRAAIQSALQDVLLRPISWETMSCGISTCLQSIDPSEVEVIPIATLAGPLLCRSVQVAKSQIPATIDPKNDIMNEAQSQIAEAMDRAKIAIVGMSGRFPGAENVDSLWELLMAGRDMCKEVPPTRWNVDTHVDPTGKRKNTSKIRWGCWLDNPDMFDARFFNMSPREAPQVDPAQRIALLTAYEAIEQAGIVPGRTPSTQEDRVGVFFGTTSNDWCESNSGQDIDTYYIPGANRAFIPGRINYVFKFSGPSYSIDTACSSSLSALHVACNALWHGDIDTAIAGGTNVLTNPDMTAGLDRGHFLSATGNCKTFDDTADGYCRGEGVATVVLKRMDDAIADKDPILGVIRGVYTNHSAEAESITRPHVGAQKAIFQHVLNHSGIRPQDISYIEMHGTGTQAGDMREMTSVLDTFSPQYPGAVQREKPLYLGAVKSNIGHGESVSGVTALVKVIMMMQNNTIPPHRGVHTRLNRRFPSNLDERNVHIAFQATEWPRGQTPRRAFINNFSAAGGNSSVLVEDPPLILKEEGSDPRSSHVIAVSAKSPSALRKNLESMRRYAMSEHIEKSLCELSYTTTARRIHHSHRLMFAGSSLEDILREMESKLAIKEPFSPCAPLPSVIFTFTGQGAQYPGMGQVFFNNFSVFRSDLCRLDDLAQKLGFPTFLPIFSASTHARLEGFTPTVVQLANTCMQLALTRLWVSWGIRPSAVVGHSIGEYAALNTAGVLSDADTVYLVGKRAQLLEEKCNRGSHTMLAALASFEKVSRLLDSAPCEVACINGPEEIVLAGPRSHMTDIQKILVAHSIRCTMLQVPFAFHSSQVDPILQDFQSAIEGVTFHKPTIPVISPLLGDVVTETGTFNPKYLARHCREPVNILQALRQASTMNLVHDSSVVMEFGPHPVVSGMVKSTLGNSIKALPTLQRNRNTWEVLTESVSTLYCMGFDINWTEYHRDFPSSQRVLRLPSYSWDLKSYWIPYRNDWTLYKGDIVPESSIALPTHQNKPHSTSPKQQAPTPILETTTLHRIVDEKSTEGTFSITCESDVSRPDLSPLVQGHKVEGIGLCTPSVYADIGFTLGNYLLDRFPTRFGPDTKVVDVTDMVIEKALMPLNAGPQLLRVTASLIWSEKEASVRFYSVDENHTETVQHSHCRIKFSDRSTYQAYQEQISAVKARMFEMKANSSSGRTYRFNGPMAYNMVQALAEFHPDYRCIDETILDNETLEAACTVSFGNVKKEGVFHTHPGYIDGLTQSGGFVMNANDKTNLGVEVFVNHGWDSFQLYEPVTDDRSYQTHVRMRPAESNQWKGDVVVLSGENLVACVRGLTIQGVPRRVLRYILQSSAKTTQTATSSVPAPSQAPVMVPQIVQVPKAKPICQISGTLTEALRIICEQSGVPLAELTDDATFANIGVDSLLALTITSAFVEELDLDVNSSLFMDYPTVADLKRFFDKINTQHAPAPAPVSDAPKQLQPSSSPVASATPSAPIHGRSKFESVLHILTEESGVEMAGLPDSTALADIGIDSLLSLVVTSRLNDELELDVSSEDFNDCLTIRDLKAHFMSNNSDNGSSAVLTPQPSRDSALPERTRPRVADTSDEEDAPVSANEFTTSARSTSKYMAVLNIISEESGMAIEDFTDNVMFADIGIDSLLSLVIGGRIREELSFDLEVDSLFVDHPDVKGLKSFFGFESNKTATNPTASQSSSSISSGTSVFDTSPSPTDLDILTPESSLSQEEFEQPLTIATKPLPPATSVTLQGLPSKAHKVLFLFPDGSGSATSYAKLPRLGADVAIIGLNSPYLMDGANMTCTFDELVTLYLTEIQRRQPAGPYHLGGWSAGGILAYRAAQILQKAAANPQKPVVESLLLLDSPPPTGLGKLPKHFFDYCDQIGIFGQGTAKAPEWLITHFQGTNSVLHEYHATPFSFGTAPRTGIIWASQTVFETRAVAPPPVRPDDTEDMKFLTERRTDFSAGPWEHMFPGTEVLIETAYGADHFSLLQEEPYKGAVRAFMSRVLQL
ncbi:hypothetical protein DTO282F9_2646 [Paecilomyces variotii]|nr:hypothetical protein DTO282F9_2646 [Paecilomyces variotii]